MKLTVVSSVILLVVVYVSASSNEPYGNKFENIEVDKIIQNDWLLRKYLNCLMERGRCSSDGNDLKRILPDALATDCQKCSPNQKNSLTKIMKYLAENKYDLWVELMDKYDPDSKYRTKFEKELMELGIRVQP